MQLLQGPLPLPDSDSDSPSVAAASTGGGTQVAPPQLLPAPQLLPGNVDGAEKFPDFCLHGGGDSPSNRTSIYSQFSTTSTSPTEYSSAGPDSTQNSPSANSSRERTASTSPAPRSRRDKKELHAARLQRSASNTFGLGRRESQSSKSRRFHRGSDPAAALAAVEPPHELGLTKMAFAEQQRWITVQQKTFTKWCGRPLSVLEQSVGTMLTWD